MDIPCHYPCPEERVSYTGNSLVHSNAQGISHDEC
jgi:hypothetical protein